VSENELDALVRASARVRDDQLAADPHIRALLTGIGREIPKHRSRWATLLPEVRWRPVFAAVAVAVLVIGVPAVLKGRAETPDPAITPTPAPKATVSLRTGDFHQTEDGTDVSEWLNLASPELPAKIQEWMANLPLPPGITWSVIQKANQDQHKWEPKIQEESFKALLGHDARCAWMGYWRSSGPEGKAQALQALEASLSWPYTTTSDWAAVIPPIVAELKSGKGRRLVRFHDEFCAVLPKVMP
jgi:hypothetical protein